MSILSCLNICDCMSKKSNLENIKNVGKSRNCENIDKFFDICCDDFSLQITTNNFSILPEKIIINNLTTLPTILSSQLEILKNCNAGNYNLSYKNSLLCLNKLQNDTDFIVYFLGSNTDNTFIFSIFTACINLSNNWSTLYFTNVEYLKGTVNTGYAQNLFYILPKAEVLDNLLIQINIFIKIDANIPIVVSNTSIFIGFDILGQYPYYNVVSNDCTYYSMTYKPIRYNNLNTGTDLFNLFLTEYTFENPFIVNLYYLNPFDLYDPVGPVGGTHNYKVLKVGLYSCGNDLYLISKTPVDLSLGILSRKDLSLKIKEIK